MTGQPDLQLVPPQVRPLAKLRRDLAAAARLVTPVLELLADSAQDVGPLARALDASEEEVRDALMLLEAKGLARSTRYVATTEGRREAQS